MLDGAGKEAGRRATKELGRPAVLVLLLSRDLLCERSDVSDVNTNPEVLPALFVTTLFFRWVLDKEEDESASPLSKSKMRSET